MKCPADWVIAGIRASLLLALHAGCSRPAAIFPPQAPPRTAASSTGESRWDPVLVDIDGRELRPAHDTRAIALVFILPDCPICNSYLPELNRLHETFANRDVTLALIHADPDIAPERAREHANEYQIQWPIVLDPRHEWVKRAGATIAPEAAVFSRTGDLLYRGRIDNQYAGLGKRRASVTSHDLSDALEATLAGRQAPEPRTKKR
jgi:thiol-disulfide isomerase/thioredoxin